MSAEAIRLECLQSALQNVLLGPSDRRRDLPPWRWICDEATFSQPVCRSFSRRQPRAAFYALLKSVIANKVRRNEGLPPRRGIAPQGVDVQADLGAASTSGIAHSVPGLGRYPQRC